MVNYWTIHPIGLPTSNWSNWNEQIVDRKCSSKTLFYRADLVANSTLLFSVIKCENCPKVGHAIGWASNANDWFLRIISLIALFYCLTWIASSITSSITSSYSCFFFIHHFILFLFILHLIYLHGKNIHDFDKRTCTMNLIIMREIKTCRLLRNHCSRVGINCITVNW